jgi:hypothetical protein
MHDLNIIRVGIPYIHKFYLSQRERHADKYKLDLSSLESKTFITEVQHPAPTKPGSMPSC